MKRLEIITNAGVYTAEVDPFEYVVGGDEAPTEEQLFDLVRKDALSGCYLVGWTPTDDKKSDPPCIFAIEQGARVISTKIYEYHSVGVEGFNADATSTPNTVYPFTYFGEYLNNKLKITGVAYRTDTTEYILPVFVNDQPATEYMKPAALAQQLQLCKEAEGVAPTDYLIIIPDVWLNEKNASDYLVSYVNEAEPQTTVHGKGTAKAWAGWNEEA
jgi:hypothetical protein